MKNLLIALFLITSTATFAQSKNEKATLEVDGVCGMCKERIEKACITSKGVKSAIWDVETHELALIYNAQKTDLATIKKRIASVGHDVEEVKATDEAYNSVHPCCRYRDQVVKDDHKTGKTD
ncbi:heavy-metal-associated domain-containing protein [Mesonia sp. K7]|uniref:heavy-metal-associated domain-containing protein n=1 Tax=Mesonia sp. K7 TaxID=2218606 RepID=UPI000DA8A224|nr:heavy-metal-associated domain-containing protein [Mesonia sp. K7]PZD77611.1 ATPase [Mesonia sp. K7]